MVRQFRGAIEFDEGGPWDSDDVPFIPKDTTSGRRKPSDGPSRRDNPHQRAPRQRGESPQYEPRARRFDYPPTGTIKRTLQVYVSQQQYEALQRALAPLKKSFQRQLIEWMLPHLEQWADAWPLDPEYKLARTPSARPQDAKLLAFQVTPQHNFAARREAESLGIGAVDLLMATINDPLNKLLRRAA